MFNKILELYALNPERYSVTEFGTGLINNTWQIRDQEQGQHFILQRINHDVFKRPEDIASNIRHIAVFLQEHYPEYLFITPLQTRDGKEMYKDPVQGYFRIFPFLSESFSVDVVSDPREAREAARQFALFTKLLSRMALRHLKITVPDFHNLSLRYSQFRLAQRSGHPSRIREAADMIRYLESQQSIVSVFEAISQNPQFRQRVTHHDTKISNVLFNRAGEGLCVIDLDTVMPGYFISDVGDMMRTYLSPANEEESDYSKIHIREDFFRAILKGYLSQMREELSDFEKAHFLYAGKFMIYMQAIRFLTDYLLHDRYYTPRYETHNLVRAGNQTVLLQKLIENEASLNEMVKEYTAMPL